MSDQPCPKCGEGCVACFRAGLSHGEALAERIQVALTFYLTHWHDGTRGERFASDIAGALKEWKP